MPPAPLPGGEDTASIIRWTLPRLRIEKDLANTIVRQVLANPRKAPEVSWPGRLLRAHREGPKRDALNLAFRSCLVHRLRGRTVHVWRLTIRFGVDFGFSCLGQRLGVSSSAGLGLANLWGELRWSGIETVNSLTY